SAFYTHGFVYFGISEPQFSFIPINTVLRTTLHAGPAASAFFYIRFYHDIFSTNHYQKFSRHLLFAKYCFEIIFNLFLIILYFFMLLIIIFFIFCIVIQMVLYFRDNLANINIYIRKIVFLKYADILEIAC